MKMRVMDARLCDIKFGAIGRLGRQMCKTCGNKIPTRFSCEWALQFPNQEKSAAAISSTEVVWVWDGILSLQQSAQFLSLPLFA